MLLRRDRALTAVTIMLDVAFHAGRLGTASTAEIAGRTGLMRRGIEPVLQALTRAGLLESTRGPRGGYRLGRARNRITLAEVVAAVGGPDPGGEASGEAEAGPAQEGALQEAVIAPLWRELDELVLARLRRTTVEELLKRAERAGLQRPREEPLSFSI